MRASPSKVVKRGPFGVGGRTSMPGWLRVCYLLVGAFVAVVGLSLLYATFTRGAKRANGGSGAVASNGALKAASFAESGLLTVPAPDGAPSTRDKCGRGDPADPDAWLDYVAEPGCYPEIKPSWYAQVHGIEPFERADLKPFDLHVYPTDNWYDLAKKATDRCDLELHQQITGGEKGLADEVVWVSGLFDLKRGESGNKDFQRPMDEYYRRFNNVLNRGFKMVIFIPREFEEHLDIDKSRVHVIYMNREDLHSYFPYFDRLSAIRTSKLWNEQAVQTGWLSNAPQARLAEYNPLVMSKFMMLRDAARLNVWGARYHLWMDAGHLCAGDQNPGPEGTSFYRSHMAEGLFVTHWPYGTTTEVHGLTDKAMHLYLAQAEDPLEIVRGGIFGGTLPHIECVLRAYILALHQTMMDGYVGTEECIWAMVHKRLPHLFKSSSNNSQGNHGDNCNSFSLSKQEENRIKSGQAKAFVSPDIPKYPSWWEAAQAQGRRSTGGGSGGSGSGSGGGTAAALRRAGGFGTRVSA